MDGLLSLFGSSIGAFQGRFPEPSCTPRPITWHHNLACLLRAVRRSTMQTYFMYGVVMFCLQLIV